MRPLHTLGGATLLLGRSAGALRRISGREVLRQTHEIGNRSLGLVSIAMFFFGAAIITMAHHQSTRFVGNVGIVGPPYFQLIVREFGPLATAILIAARYGALSAAELSAMAVNEQLEALVMCAGDPVVDLVAPRALAGMIAFPAVSVLGSAIAILSAAYVGKYAFEIDPSAFLDPRFVTHADILCGLGKAAVCGLWVPAVAAWAGFSAKGGAEAVGTRTTDGVVAACLGCLVIDFLFAVGFRLVHL